MYTNLKFKQNRAQMSEDSSFTNVSRFLRKCQQIPMQISKDSFEYV